MTSCAGSKSTSATYLKDIGRPMEYPAWLKRHPIGKNAKVKRAKDLLSFQKESNKEAEKLSRFESKIQEINAKTEAIKDN
jgi:hypothetical protein